MKNAVPIRCIPYLLRGGLHDTLLIIVEVSSIQPIIFVKNIL